MNNVLLASEQLKGFTVVNLAGEAAASSLSQWLEQFGPTTTTRFGNLSQAFDFLFPVKSFPKRYLVIDLGQWSCFLTDSRDENGYVEGYAVSRQTKCRALGITIRNDARQVQVFEEGKHLREVDSSLDVDRWYYREGGAMQPFEDIEEITRRRKQDRLSVAAVQTYFNRYTGLALPNWKSLRPACVWGIQRSWKDLEVPVIKFDTIRDI